MQEDKDASTATEDEAIPTLKDRILTLRILDLAAIFATEPGTQLSIIFIEWIAAFKKSILPLN